LVHQAMVASGGGETAPLRAREEATPTEAASTSGRDRRRGHGGSYEAGDDVLLGARAFPAPDEGADTGGDDARGTVRRVLYSTMTAATMVSSAHCA
jgi:hypothetical protein